MSRLNDADRELAWAEIEQQFLRFEGPSGFEAPSGYFAQLGHRFRFIAATPFADCGRGPRSEATLEFFS